MKNIKRSNIITAIICAASLTVSYHIGTVAAGNQETFNSQGKIVFDNNTKDSADDVIFDANDFKIISDMVIAGKRQVAAELNKYPSVNFNMTNSIPDFSELANAIDTLTDDATAENNKILKDYTAYVKSSKIKGTIPSKEAAAYTPGRSDQTIAAGQYLSGVQTIKGDTNLTAANIIAGKTIFGVAGSAQAETHTIEATKSVNITNTSGTITPSSGNNAMSSVTYSISGVDASKIISGKSILGVAGSAVTESHTEMSRSFSQSEMATADITLEAGKGVTIPANQYLTSSLTINSSKGYKLYAKNVDLPWTPPTGVTDYIIVPTYIVCSGNGTVSGNNGSATATCGVSSSSGGTMIQENGGIEADGSFKAWCSAFNGSPSFSVNFTKGDIYANY